jgi:hypothetical protein
LASANISSLYQNAAALETKRRRNHFRAVAAFSILSNGVPL